MTVEDALASNQLRGDINVTPMIDILLVLLIIFMVIVPVLPHGLHAALPKPSTGVYPQPETPIVVQIASNRDGLLSYKINRESVSVQELGGRLSAILSGRADRVMFVEGNGDLDFSTVAKVVDIAKGAGADHIGLTGDILDAK